MVLTLSGRDYDGTKILAAATGNPTPSDKEKDSPEDSA